MKLSAMADISLSLPDTQTQNGVDWTQEKDEIQIPQIWGWLYPARPHLKSIDLCKSSFLLGRSQHCDMIVDGSHLSPTILRIVSKEHFFIYHNKSVDETSPIYIEDRSYNGTFVNGKKIGRGTKIILQSDDEIAVGHPTIKIYTFKCISDEPNVAPEISSKYVVSKTLGHGVCGEVKLIWNKITCQRYAMKKILKKKFPTCKFGTEKICNEVAILKGLNHPCVIKLEEIIDTNEAVYIILELMEGGELFDRIVTARRNQFWENTAKLYFYQIVLAVKYLHEKGITHRDLKPENVLLLNNQTETLIKVSDFGLSKFVDQESVMKTMCGTPMYVAPEVLKTHGKGAYTKQVDIWSLGVILYVLISGYIPFNQDNSSMALSDQILTGTYSFPVNIFANASPSVIDLIKHLLVVDPEKRFSIDQILNHQWLKDEHMIIKAGSLMGIDTMLTNVDLNSNGDCYQPAKRRRIQETPSSSSSSTDQENINPNE